MYIPFSVLGLKTASIWSLWSLDNELFGSSHAVSLLPHSIYPTNRGMYQVFSPSAQPTKKGASYCWDTCFINTELRE